MAPETCSSHGTRLFRAALGSVGMYCGICLEPTCDTCDEPYPFCICEKDDSR